MHKVHRKLEDFSSTKNDVASEDGGKRCEDDIASAEDSCTITVKDNLDLKRGQIYEESVSL